MAMVMMMKEIMMVMAMVTMMVMVMVMVMVMMIDDCDYLSMQPGLPCKTSLINRHTLSIGLGRKDD